MNIAGLDHKSSGIYPKKPRTVGASDTQFAELLNSVEEEIRTPAGFAHLSEAPDTNKYFRLADENGIINYRGTIFHIDRRHNNLLLGDCSDSKKCLRIPLSGGGNLIVNRENLGELSSAISMFNAEDIGRILRAVELDKFTQERALELEEESDEEMMETAANT